MKLHSRLGLILSTIYISIFVLSEFLTLFALIFETANSDLSGVLAILVTLPWSIMLVSICNATGYIAWYDRFAGTPVLYGFFAMLGILPGAILNTIILYQIGRAMDGGNTR